MNTLTYRELEVLRLVADGLSNVGIAAALFVSPRTVESHLRSIRDKLNIEDEPTVNVRVLAAMHYVTALAA